MVDTRRLFNRMGYAGQLGELGDVLFGLQNGLDGKVSMEEGKVLSSNDFTDKYKQALQKFFEQRIIPSEEAVALTREEFLALASWDSSTLYVVTYTDPEGTERVELFVGDQIIDVFAA